MSSMYLVYSRIPSRDTFNFFSLRASAKLGTVPDHGEPITNPWVWQ